MALSARQRAIVARLARSRTEPQRVVERAQIVLRSGEGDLCVEQARSLGVSAQRVRRWRKRFSEQREVLSRVEAESPEEDDAFEEKIQQLLADEYRSGTLPRFTPEQVTSIVAWACHTPEELDLPISHWTPDELARQAIAMGIVKSISGRRLDRFLKEADLRSHLSRYWLNPNVEDQHAVSSPLPTEGKGDPRRQL